MPIYKALILNKEISVNYEENQKDKLVEAIKVINSKLKSYDSLNGKISDSKLLSFLAIKLQAELIDLSETNTNRPSSDKKSNKSDSEKIILHDKIYQLREQNKLLTKENETMNQELINLKNQIDIIIDLVKKTYEE